MIGIVVDFAEGILTVVFHLIRVFFEGLVLFEFIVNFKIIFAGFFHQKSSKVIVSAVLAEPFPVVEHLGESVECEAALIAGLGLLLDGIGMQGEQ